MFTSIINAFKDAPVDHTAINKANQALAERMDHMLRVESLSARIVKLEVKKPELVKNPNAILLKKSFSLRRSFAA